VIDGRGRRIGKKVNGALVQGYLYMDLLRPVAELGSNGNVVSYFVYGDTINLPEYIVSRKADGINWTLYRFITDNIGNPRLVINATTGAVIQQLTFDEFGKVLVDDNLEFQPFGYSGGLYDRQTGLVRFGKRDYDPTVGRWTAKDPILFDGEDTNLFGYVLNDPINEIDPEGTRNLGTRNPGQLPPSQRPPTGPYPKSSKPCLKDGGWIIRKDAPKRIGYFILHLIESFLSGGGSFLPPVPPLPPLPPPPPPPAFCPAETCEDPVQM
jgi:RHS repeat-associated protein